LIACHNRREKTLACLKSLFDCTLPVNISLDIFLVDDGSQDGTGESVHRLFPSVHVIDGDGNLYWNGGMRVAFAAALKQNFDYYLWLNDDTLLYQETISGLLNSAKVNESSAGRAVAVVGTTQLSHGCPPTYGGLVSKNRWKKLSFSIVDPLSNPLSCDTVNGNCLLIPKAIARAVGNLDSAFAHSMGDIDYGFRIRKEGFPIVVMAGYAGSCAHNSIDNTFLDSRLDRRERWKKIVGPKGLPPKQWFILTRRHAGVLWPIFWIWPYLRVIF
jgi:GT2 family glycosyltransferase